MTDTPEVKDVFFAMKLTQRLAHRLTTSPIKDEEDGEQEDEGEENGEEEEEEEPQQQEPMLFDDVSWLATIEVCLENITLSTL